jgi:hypothetical protein
MSRNLGDTCCRICSGDGDVHMIEAPRPITAEECGAYADLYVGHLVVARAICSFCGAKYLAWVSHDLAGWKREPSASQSFVDLSFRRAFNDEPAAEDLPTPEMLKMLHMRECLERVKELRVQVESLLLDVKAAEENAETGKSYWESYRR